VGEREDLSEMYRTLAVHPGFRVSRLRRHTGGSPALLRLGRLIKQARLLRRGAEFAGQATLLDCRARLDPPGRLILDLQWHCPRTRPQWWVFVHFLDSRGEIRFQGDHRLEEGDPDELGFLELRRIISPPSDARGEFRIRLGVWTPDQGIHLSLTRCRGWGREAPGWCHNAVLLGSIWLGG